MTGVFKRVDLNTVCALKFVVGRTKNVQGNYERRLNSL